MNKIASFIKKGKLHFKNPSDTRETLVASPISVKSSSRDEFSWNGQFDDNRGDITLIAHDGDIFGRFNIDGEVYEIQDLGRNKNVFVKYSKSQKSFCSNHSQGKNGFKQPTTSESLTNSSLNMMPPLSCDNHNVRILVLYTDRVAFLQNPQNIASLAINQLNLATANSGISSAELSFTLAGVAPYPVPGYQEKASIFSTMQDFKLATNDEVLRNQYQADLVILLTSKIYDSAE